MDQNRLVCRLTSVRNTAFGLTRRRILQLLPTAGPLWTSAIARRASAQPSNLLMTAKTVRTPILDVGFEDSGSGFPVILLHGFPDDVRAFDGVVPPLVQAGYRVVVPYLRGYGPTRFLDAQAARTGEQAAIGQDVVDFADALQLPRFAVAGFDWGGRAACVASILVPDRVRAGVFIGGYSIQNTVDAGRPAPPQAERNLWYQYYFNTERGRAGLTANRKAICKYLWELWSPSWKFTDDIYNRTAASFENPDFVDVVIHSYRHRILNAAGEARFLDLEKRLATRPKITVPAITLHGADDGIARPPADNPNERTQFTRLLDRRVVAGAGHFVPREKPEAVATALLDLLIANP